MDALEEIEIPWVKPEDALNRKPQADFLTAVLGDKKEPYVLNLNAPWGYGKTYFVQHWAKELKEKHPVVYINAWESDHSGDPLLAVFSAINSQLLTQLAKRQEILQKLLPSIGRLLKNVSPTIAKGLTAKLLTEEAVEALSNDVTEIGDEEARMISNLVGDTAKKLIDDFESKQQAVSAFKLGLESTVSALKNDTPQKQLPVFIFIDELDRCRPTYAVEVLERIKHFFNIEGIVFVISTDTSQLQHSICAVYGEQFHGAKYLDRFFNQSFTLPAPNNLSFLKTLKRIDDDKLMGRVTFLSFEPSQRQINASEYSTTVETDYDNLIAALEFSASTIGLSLRDIHQVHSRLTAIYKSHDLIWDGMWLSILLCLQVKNQKLFDNIYRVVKDKVLDGTMDGTSPLFSNERVYWHSNWDGNLEPQKKYMEMSEIISHYIQGIVKGTQATKKTDGSSANSLLATIHNRTFIEKYASKGLYVSYELHFDAVKQAGYLN